MTKNGDPYDGVLRFTKWVQDTSNFVVRAAELVLLVGAYGYAASVSGSAIVWAIAGVLFLILSLHFTMPLLVPFVRWGEHPGARHKLLRALLAFLAMAVFALAIALVAASLFITFRVLGL